MKEIFSSFILNQKSFRKNVLVGLLASNLLSSSAFSGDSKPSAVTIYLSTKGNDIAFDKSSLEVPMMPEIKLKFVNQASAGSQILHNVAILAPGTTQDVIKKLQASAYDIEKLRHDPAVLAMTRTLEPGQDDSIDFHPKEVGFYPFICLMPGHGDMLGMQGILSVKKMK